MCKIQVKDGQFPGIYKIEEKSTHKVYIGQTSRSINERLTQHVMHPVKGSAIDEAIQKEGENAFTFEVVTPMKDPTTEQLWFQEYYFISKFKSWNEKYGFNQTKGNHGAEFKNFEAAFMHDFICVDDELFKFIIKTYRLDFTGKRVLLINNFSESIKNYLEFQTGKENLDIIYESFDIEDKKELGEVLGEYIKAQIKYRTAVKSHIDLLTGEYVMEQPNVYYDIIIANPPYGRISNEITKCIINNFDWDVYVNLMPANDYRRNKENKLYQYVDIRSMKPVINGFHDAAVTTYITLINKERSMYLSEEEFEIENYTDKSLKKYFYETRKRSHYAIDNFIYKPTFTQFENIDIEKTVYIGKRDIAHNHLPYSDNGIAARFNRNELNKQDVINESAKSEQALGRVGDFYLICFNTKQEKTNFVNFIYSKQGFRFISKLFTAVNADSSIPLNKLFIKIDWSKAHTVQSILKDYGYTPKEIDEVIDDLANFRGMDNK